jgi:hypothetical protein
VLFRFEAVPRRHSIDNMLGHATPAAVEAAATSLLRHPPGIPAGTYTVVVTATSGSTKSNTGFTLIVQ